uniref:cDNA FLJ27034 fis, clone SLV07984 n=1 Tax=Homo sapiens TaxID=9606 RepID=Q6ZNW1_HUMAN|nr:unnamed protein product [Homo sapiens]
MNNIMHIQFHTYTGIAARKMTRSEVAGAQAYACVVLVDIVSSPSLEVVHSSLLYMKVPVCPHPPQLSVLSNCLISVSLHSRKIMFLFSFNLCIFLMSNVCFFLFMNHLYYVYREQSVHIFCL